MILFLLWYRNWKKLGLASAATAAFQRVGNEKFFFHKFQNWAPKGGPCRVPGRVVETRRERRFQWSCCRDRLKKSCCNQNLFCGKFVSHEIGKRDSLLKKVILMNFIFIPRFWRQKVLVSQMWTKLGLLQLQHWVQLPKVSQNPLEAEAKHQLALRFVLRSSRLGIGWHSLTSRCTRFFRLL